jgi:general nucleoside transport system ATP-binding protein
MSFQISPATPRLQLTNITKKYPAVIANSEVSLAVNAGEIHAVLGENGAGKSTLMKIIFGAVRPDAGGIAWEGKEVAIPNPQAARALGISMVFQHFSLFETLTVHENIALGLSPKEIADITSGSTGRDGLQHRIIEIGNTYGLEVNPSQTIHTLSVGERQRVEIIRALLSTPKLLILDEPTSVLTPQSVEKLFITLRQLASEGCSILYISHKLDEIRALCHKATVMRGGKVTGTCDPREQTAEDLSKMMIGSAPTRLNAHRPQNSTAPLRLRVTELNLPKPHTFGTALKNISFDIRAGEIVGLAGISGNGQQELMAVLSGENTITDKNAIVICDQPAGGLNALSRRELGISFIPEERLGRGAVPLMTLAQNILLSHQHAPQVRRKSLLGLVIDPQATKALAQKIITLFKVKASGSDALAKSLSGGNLQKFIVGRELMRDPKLLLVSQPTWGVDVGAAAQIRSELLALRDKGCAIFLVSEEIDELFEIADRLMVLSQGEMSPSVTTEKATVEQLGLWMSGLWPRGGDATKVDHAPH